MLALESQLFLLAPFSLHSSQQRNQFRSPLKEAMEKFLPPSGYAEYPVKIFRERRNTFAVHYS